MKEWNYMNGKAEGMQKVFYKSGHLYQEGRFKDDKLNGEAKTYFEDGKIKFIDIYNNGKLIKRKTFDELGNLTSEK